MLIRAALIHSSEYFVCSKRESTGVNIRFNWMLNIFSPNFPSYNSQAKLIIYTLAKNMSPIGYKMFSLLRQACIFRMSSLLQNGDKSQMLHDTVKNLKLIRFVMLSLRSLYTDLLKSHENPLISTCSVLYNLTPQLAAFNSYKKYNFRHVIRL
jgi:hypothetical protein